MDLMKVAEGKGKAKAAVWTGSSAGWQSVMGHDWRSQERPEKTKVNPMEWLVFKHQWRKWTVSPGLTASMPPPSHRIVTFTEYCQSQWRRGDNFSPKYFSRHYCAALCLCGIILYSLKIKKRKKSKKRSDIRGIKSTVSLFSALRREVDESSLRKTPAYTVNSGSAFPVCEPIHF